MFTLVLTLEIPAVEIIRTSTEPGTESVSWTGPVASRAWRSAENRDRCRGLGGRRRQIEENLGDVQRAQRHTI
jgi:hypothetical protein